MNAIDASMLVGINRDTTGVARSASVGSPVVSPPIAPPATALPMEWLTITMPTNTPNITPKSIGYGINQTNTTTGTLIPTDPKLPATFQAFYQLKVGDKFKISLDFTQPIAFYLMSTNSYGFDNNGANAIETAKPDDGGEQPIIMLQETSNGLFAQFMPSEDGENARVLNDLSQKIQDYLVVEYPTEGEMYITFLDGIRTRIMPNYHTLVLKSTSISKGGDGGYFPLLPITVTRAK